MFAKKQPDQLRVKLSEVERDHKISKMSLDDYTRQKVKFIRSNLYLNFFSLIEIAFYLIYELSLNLSSQLFNLYLINLDIYIYSYRLRF